MPEEGRKVKKEEEGRKVRKEEEERKEGEGGGREERGGQEEKGREGEGGRVVTHVQADGTNMLAQF